MFKSHSGLHLIDLQDISRKESTKFGMQYWVVTGNGTLMRNGKPYVGHIKVGVAARLFADAYAVAMDKYPGMTVMSIQHQGPIEVQQT